MKKDTDAVVARFQSVSQLAAKTFVARAPRASDGSLPAAPYVVIYPSDGTDTQERLTGPRSTRHPRYTAHIVGSTYDNCQKALELAKVKFIAANGFSIPIVTAGDVTRNLSWSTPQPLQVDDDTAIAPLIYATVEIGWDAEPI